MTDAIAATMAGRLLAFRDADLPELVRHEAVRTFVNWLGCALGGSQSPPVVTAERALSPFSGPAQATVVGRRGKRDVMLATLLNCLASSALAYDDTHAEMILHPTGPIASSLFALAERTPISGRDFVRALVLGMDVECRLTRAIAVAPARYNIGWYLTGLSGGAGAAAAAGIVLGLDADTLASAMSIAASEGAGNRATHSSMMSAMVPAHAGEMGLRAAFLAQQGFTGTHGFIEHPRGFGAMFGQVANLDAILDGFGERFEVMNNTYKPFPCGIVVHPLIDACLQIARKGAPPPGRIRKIAARVHQDTVTLANRPHPATEGQSSVSLQHWAVCALVDGAVGMQTKTFARINDPQIRAMRDLVEAEVDPSLSSAGASVVVTLDDGTTIARHVSDCVGSLNQPMSDADLAEKFRAQALEVLPAASVDRLLERSWRLADLDRVAVLAEDVCP